MASDGIKLSTLDPSKTVILTSAGLLTSGIIIRKLCFSSFLSLKRFFSSLCFSCAGCCITGASTYILRQTRFLPVSENYQITALLISIAGTLVYRYELYCNKGNLMPYHVFWKYLYPWMIFCIFPSVFICGFRREIDLICLEHTSMISAFGIIIGTLLPSYNYDYNDSIICSIKNFISEYTSIFISGVGCGLILVKLIMFTTQNDFRLLYPYAHIDLFFLGLVLILFGFIVEDARMLKEQTEDMDEDYEFDPLVSSIPLYLDALLLYLFAVETIESFVSYDLITV